MRYAFIPLTLGLGANALVPRSSTQCYNLKASGGAEGILGQLDDGQNRVGDHLPTGCYCLCDGGFTDSKGRGCILTPPTTQFQCDVGASPTGGFAVGSNGSVTYNGDATFYACPVNDYGVYNVYSKPVAGQDKCVKITLETAGSCGASNTPSPAPKPSPQPQPSPKPEPSPSPSNSCPQDLNGNYQYPHLIVPVDSQHPDQAYGTQYNGKVNSHTCTIFNFDIPSSYAGKTCSAIFLLPKKADLETSDYTISGSGYCTATKLKGNADQQTTWNNQPAVDGKGASFEIMPGGSWTADTFDCPAGQRISYKLCTDSDFSLEYFQDYNPSPIGMYVRQC
ncbi:hypothetical protein yc1106_03954 [Curvularia clavata]|uniref:Ubiquitin 3 binding protein But2 C-terminal domain-containing protein n=1 Tax=Curvularia clavata TaxID=95742 RepID=A0A9Q8Z6P7_CURCL|nr:hypothetical protein yc1106_03954 [Curvularia clavata]